MGTLAALVCLAGGCAARRTPALTDRFVAGSGQPIEIAVATPESPSPVVSAAAAQSLAQGPVAKATDLPTVESEDRYLAAALDAVAAARTVGSLLNLAEAYRRAGLADAAYDRAQEALELDGDGGRARELLARLWRDWGMAGHGLPEAYRAVAAAPTVAAAHNTLGTLLFAVGAVDAARARFEHVLVLDTGAAYAWNNLCYLSLTVGETARASGECARALALDPGLAAARHNLALVRAADGQLEQAERQFRASGDGALAWYNMGILHLAAHRYAAAAEAFETAYRERPDLGIAFERARDARRRAAESGDGGLPSR